MGPFEFLPDGQIRNYGPPELVPPPTFDRLPKATLIGEDGQFFVMYGHVDTRIAQALLIVAQADWTGLSYVTEQLDAFDIDSIDIDSIEHRYAVEQTDQHTLEVGIWWALDDDHVTESTPGSFPITICDMEI